MNLNLSTTQYFIPQLSDKGVGEVSRFRISLLISPHNPFNPSATFLQFLHYISPLPYPLAILSVLLLLLLNYFNKCLPFPTPSFITLSVLLLLLLKSYSTYLSFLPHNHFNSSATSPQFLHYISPKFHFPSSTSLHHPLP